MAFGRAALLERATELCEAFAQRKSLEEVLCHFSEDVLCLEHGLPELAPFLGRPFRGHAGARRYFELLAELLGFTDMAFSDYVVDVEACQVSVRGKAKFTWLSTGKSWDEVFMYRLKMDDANLISAYEVWADSGAAYLARTAPRLRVLLVSYEFTFGPFSGNGILARSVAKALLRLGCQVTVWCCRPHAEAKDQHLDFPEIPEEDKERLALVPLQLCEEHGWRKLDDASAWQHFAFASLGPEGRRVLLLAAAAAEVWCAVDWTGAQALRTLPLQRPLVYMNFRVYSSGVSATKRPWFDQMERDALANAQAVVALSEPDRMSLTELGAPQVAVLLPPLRGDVRALAAGAAAPDLPPQVQAAAQTAQRRRFLVSCVVRLSKEKQALRFARFIAQCSGVLRSLGLVPLLAGAAADGYAEEVKTALRLAAPEAVVLEDFLPPEAESRADRFARGVLPWMDEIYFNHGFKVVQDFVHSRERIL
ncbi:unnamed protein product [Effrenium voratum]|uniref:Glycosyltransferase subfamily 4-like N-terminal domain-containing protein n=1 Tax=Effrenium voratum TaxID=2562239 RepID=A0AA36HSF9_9DINO|nr:unnamed protein product [Effrenium voratum]